MSIKSGKSKAEQMIAIYTLVCIFYHLRKGSFTVISAATKAKQKMDKRHVNI